MDPKGREIAGYRMHAFVCGHTRPEGSARGCCSEKISELMKEFKLATKEKGIKDVRVQKSGCLDFCENPALLASFIHKASGSKSPRKPIPSLVEYMDGGKLPTQFLLDLKVSILGLVAPHA